MASVTATASPSAAPLPGNPSPPRAGRPSNPRPTTYSGMSPAVHSSNASQAGPSHSHSHSNSVSANGPPIQPPPRTSSQRQVPVTASAAGTSTERSRSTSNRVRGPSADGRERERDQRDKERERADREKRRGDEGSRSRREQQPVGRSNSTRDPVRNASNPQPSQPTERPTSSRRRQESTEGAGGNRSRQASSGGGGGGGGGGGLAVVNTPDGPGRSTGSGRKETRFGEYILGQTLGEGEFGKVKLGWRKDGGVQVAIKLIRRDSLSPHPNRLGKIYREISILRTLSHPNIVRLHEMVETERHIGIILEYASGGELFDYILTHRYLKDPPACRLFAQLVSGVGYLHKKGIVHRDLKLENLLLDRNRNIIITDFGFANVFDPRDELGELEDRLDEPGILKELEKGVPNDAKKDEGNLLSILGPGQVRRRGDLMATSCGSPCYAAPELVVSDGLYTGRKVDVWSCGVILYAMLAGYLPFDDDPANPEGDNINLLYKYIVSTPLTFPEYVSPHARDLLRRILVPDPRKRADLFEVARHSWLSPFANVVSLITSATTGVRDVEDVTVKSDNAAEIPLLARSASVREPSSTTNHPHASALGARHHTHEHPPSTQSKETSDAKRRTVQVEYVEPDTSTKRGSAVDPDYGDSVQRSNSRRRAEDAAPPPSVPMSKADPSLARAATTAGTIGVPSRTLSTVTEKQKGQQSSPDKPRSRPVSYQHQQPSNPRPSATTDGNVSRMPSRDRNAPPVSKPFTSAENMSSSARPVTANSLGSNRLPSRGGSYSRPAAPSLASNNVQGRIAMPKSGKPYISNPIPQEDNSVSIGTGEMGKPSTAALPAKFRPMQQGEQVKGHKRASTVDGGGGETGRFLGKFMGSSDRQDVPRVMSGAGEPRQSLDQGRGSKYDKATSGKSRRFSLLPISLSLRNFSNSGEGKHERRSSRSASGQSGRQFLQSQPQASSHPTLGVPSAGEGGSVLTGSDTSLAVGSAPPSAAGGGAFERESVDVCSRNGSSAGGRKPAVLQKNRKFTEAYEGETGGSGGSSGPARRVMDFFRMRGVRRSNKGGA